MINSTPLAWLLGTIVFIALFTVVMHQTNKDLVKIDTEHCVSLQEAMARYPHSNADVQFEMDGCEALLVTE